MARVCLPSPFLPCDPPGVLCFLTVIQDSLWTHHLEQGYAYQLWVLWLLRVFPSTFLWLVSLLYLPIVFAFGFLPWLFLDPPPSHVVLGFFYLLFLPLLGRACSPESLLAKAHLHT